MNPTIGPDDRQSLASNTYVATYRSSLGTCLLAPQCISYPLPDPAVGDLISSFAACSREERAISIWDDDLIGEFANPIHRLCICRRPCTFTL